MTRGLRASERIHRFSQYDWTAELIVNKWIHGFKRTLVSARSAAMLGGGGGAFFVLCELVLHAFLKKFFLFLFRWLLPHAAAKVYEQHNMEEERNNLEHAV